MKALKWAIGGALAALLLWSSPGARASMVRALDLSELVAKADQVLVARVVSQESHYDERGRIVTDVQMQIERVEKGEGAEGAVVIVRRLGGVVDGTGLHIEGEPSFEVGEAVLLFGARARGQEVLRPVGMSQGAMQVFEQDGERWVRSAAGNVSLVRKGAKGELEGGAAAVPEPRRLEDVLSDIRREVATAKAKAPSAPEKPARR